MAGFCRVWIPTCGLLVKPLYEALKGPEDLTLEWTPDMEAVFKQIKKSPSHGPSPRSTRSDKTVLFVHEKKGVALGVLTQPLGPS